MMIFRLSSRNIIKRKSFICSIFNIHPFVMTQEIFPIDNTKEQLDIKNGTRFIFNKYFHTSHQEVEKSELIYNQLADETLENLLEKLENYIDDININEDLDIRLEQGVLTMQLGSKGTFVINKQTPNKQIWLSSPLSGPFRYTYVDGYWKYHRDNHILNDKLSRELEFLFNKKIKL